MPDAAKAADSLAVRLTSFAVARKSEQRHTRGGHLRSCLRRHHAKLGYTLSALGPGPRGNQQGRPDGDASPGARHGLAGVGEGIERPACRVHEHGPDATHLLGLHRDLRCRTGLRGRERGRTSQPIRAQRDGARADNPEPTHTRCSRLRRRRPRREPLAHSATPPDACPAVCPHQIYGAAARMDCRPSRGRQNIGRQTGFNRDPPTVQPGPRRSGRYTSGPRSLQNLAPRATRSPNPQRHGRADHTALSVTSPDEPGVPGHPRCPVNGIWQLSPPPFTAMVPEMLPAVSIVPSTVNVAPATEAGMWNVPPRRSIVP